MQDIILDQDLRPDRIHLEVLLTESALFKIVHRQVPPQELHQKITPSILKYFKTLLEARSTFRNPFKRTLAQVAAREDRIELI